MLPDLALSSQSMCFNSHSHDPFSKRDLSGSVEQQLLHAISWGKTEFLVHLGFVQMRTVPGNGIRYCTYIHTTCRVGQSETESLASSWLHGDLTPGAGVNASSFDQGTCDSVTQNVCLANPRDLHTPSRGDIVRKVRNIQLASELAL